MADPERYATAAQLAVEVRVQASMAQNEDRLKRCLDAASIEAEHAVGASHVDALAGNALCTSVVLARAVEWWKANDASFGVIGTDQTGQLQSPPFGFNRHAGTLVPIGRAFGVA